jgi:hypothetical protein
MPLPPIFSLFICEVRICCMRTAQSLITRFFSGKFYLFFPRDLHLTEYHGQGIVFQTLKHEKTECNLKCPLHCTVRSLHCAVRSLHCAVRSLHCTVRSLHCAVRSLHCAVRSLHCTVRSLHCAVRYLLLSHSLIHSYSAPLTLPRSFSIAFLFIPFYAHPPSKELGTPL